jgi:hypothetical protein
MSARTPTDIYLDHLSAVIFVVLFVGFPLFAAYRLLTHENPIDYHWPSFWLGVLSVLLVVAAAVYARMLWIGQVTTNRSSGSTARNT